MSIAVILKSGKELYVTRDELQYLLVTEQIVSFKRSDGWAIVERDIFRSKALPFTGKERRHDSAFLKDPC